MSDKVPKGYSKVYLILNFKDNLEWSCLKK